MDLKSLIDRQYKLRKLVDDLECLEIESHTLLCPSVANAINSAKNVAGWELAAVAEKVSAAQIEQES